MTFEHDDDWPTNCVDWRAIRPTASHSPYHSLNQQVSSPKDQSNEEIFTAQTDDDRCQCTQSRKLQFDKQILYFYKNQINEIIITGGTMRKVDALLLLFDDDDEDATAPLKAFIEHKK